MSFQREVLFRICNWDLGNICSFKLESFKYATTLQLNYIQYPFVFLSVVLTRQEQGVMTRGILDKRGGSEGLSRTKNFDKVVKLGT